jgi:succinate dehydrogenase/fumarate reductase flavoprotein subunit
MKGNKSGFCVLALAVAILAGCGTAGTGGAVSPSVWDAEYDVIVIGFGGAGANASIAAAEAGAKVLLTEKAPEGHEGGNTRYCAQVILNYWDYDKGLAYVTAANEGYEHMTPDMLNFIVKSSRENADWLESIGVMRPKASTGTTPLGEYPELPGADTAYVDFIMDSSILSGKTYWESMRKAVVARKDRITVWFESPAKRLIQDPATKTVTGVQIQRGGKTLNVRAKNGVVMAMGGFENNEEMVENYTERERMFPLGSPYNTGDGVKMAIDVGADLWHMNALSGPWITVKTPDMDRAYFNSMVQNLAKNYAAIYVGKDGSRFMNESGWQRHGHAYYSGSFYSQTTPDPMYIIFDESARKAGLVVPPSFSADLSAEIANGTIVQAETNGELARKIGVRVDSPQPNVTAQAYPGWDETYRTAGLVNQVKAYNQYCVGKFDPQFNRRPNTLVPIAQAPFYAMELQPAMVNTQGGARRNLEMEVLTPYGEVIPHLYSAGNSAQSTAGFTPAAATSPRPCSQAASQAGTQPGPRATPPVGLSARQTPASSPTTSTSPRKSTVWALTSTPASRPALGDPWSSR